MFLSLSFISYRFNIARIVSRLLVKFIVEAGFIDDGNARRAVAWSELYNMNESGDAK